MNLERWTLCLLRGHRWGRVPYDDDGDAYYIRSTVCGYENHHAAMPGRPNLF